jgi:signal transduction histidine kinase
VAKNIYNFDYEYDFQGHEDGDPMLQYNGDIFAPRETESTHDLPYGPFPMMPSQTFLALANSQFELLSNALFHTSSIQSSVAPSDEERRKIKSIVLYLPQEHSSTGQLEFVPSIVYPSHPKSERVFIASDANSGIAPTIPPTLTQLPGFSHASSLIPTYPFTASSTSTAIGSSAAVGTPEEVMCDLSTGNGSSAALSLPLFSGAQTVGVVLVWSSPPPHPTMTTTWTSEDKEQIRRVGETLALALCMDSEMYQNRLQTEQFKVAMADSLHQVKNPVQALRTFSKLLQRNLDTMEENPVKLELSALAEHVVTQSERVVDLLLPMDSIIDSLDGGMDAYQRLLAPMEETSLILRSEKQDVSSYRSLTINGTDASYSDWNKKKSRTGETIPTSSRHPAYAQTSDNSMQSPAPAPYAKNLRVEMSFVTDVIKPILSASKAIATDRGIDFQVYGMEDDNELPGILLSPKVLQEAVVNVLDNALKYVQLGSSGIWGIQNACPIVRVTVEPNAPHLQSGVTIWVEDNGPGISYSFREEVFNRGYRGNESSLMSDGSGIGLDISRAMIARIGGTLTAERITPDRLEGAIMRFVLYRKPSKRKAKNRS